MDEFLKGIDQELPPAQAQKVHGTLFKVLGNILRNPCEPKFRTLRKENKLVAENICISMAAVSLLFMIGFEDRDESYHCPMSTDLEQMQALSDVLRDMTLNLEALEHQSTTAPEPLQPAERPVVARKNAERSPPESEKQRRAQSEQLQALRAERHAQHTSSAPATNSSQELHTNQVPLEDLEDLITLESEPLTVNDLIPADVGEEQHGNMLKQDQVDGDHGSSTKGPPRTAFEFKRRTESRQGPSANMEEIRRLQQERFKQFQNNSDARLSASYSQPPSGSLNPEVQWRTSKEPGSDIMSRMSDTSEHLFQGASQTSEKLSSGLADVSKQVSEGFAQHSARISSEFEGFRERISTGGWFNAFAPAEAGPGPLPARFRVISKLGALVRVGVEKDSDSVEMLQQHMEFTALESQMSMGGTLRLRLEEPLKGWVSFKATIIERVGEASDGGPSKAVSAPSQSPEGQPHTARHAPRQSPEVRVRGRELFTKK